MTWIATVPPELAAGPLAASYAAAVARAGRVAGIVRAMSQDPRVLEASMALYLRVMLAPGGLGRRRREMIAVVVSAANGCHY
ncbi:MAG: carboxymuconolactone decarboxylase family protein [Planctomycetota bacterium]